MKRRQDESFERHLRESTYEQHLGYIWKQAKSRYVQPWDRSPVLNPCAAFPSLPPHYRFNAASGPSTLPPQVPAPGSSMPPKSDVSGFIPPLAKDTGKPWEVKLTENRLAALIKWERVLNSHKEHFGLMDKVAGDSGMSTSLQTVLRDVFAMKASSTLHSRVGPVLRFIKHCQDAGIAPFPLREANLYDFLKGYCSKQAPTFGKSFLGSVAFMQHVLEATLESPVFSTRVSGAANLMFLEKRKQLQQKPPLTVQHVKALEGILFGEGGLPPCDQYAAGCFLFALYARARFSDMQASGDLVTDVVDTKDGPHGYLEASVTRTTAYNLERKTRFLAMCATIQGLSQDSWALKWVEIAQAHGPEWGPGKPLVPAPVEGGGWQMGSGSRHSFDHGLS